MHKILADHLMSLIVYLVSTAIEQATVAVLTILLASVAPVGAQVTSASPLAQSGITQEPATTHEFRLANGLRLIVKEDHRAPTVVHQVWYRAGSIDEVSGTTGVAHMLEHMMFRGTPTYPAGAFSRVVAEMGGRDNAMTSRDFTMYYQQVGKAHLPKVMAMEADRMVNLVMSDDDFAREMKVVMEERRLRTDDSPPGTLFEQLMATMYAASPYRHPIIGWMDDLKNMQPEDALTWYRNWYAPNNVVVVVVGDVDPQAVYREAERTYGKVASRPLPRRTLREEPPQKGIKRLAVAAPAESSSIVMAFKVPGLRAVEGDIDGYALEVLAAVLSGYENARLDRRLVREQRLADSVSASYDGLGRGPARFTVAATPAKGQSTDAVEQAIRAEIARVATEGVSSQELRRIKTQLIASQVYKRDSVFGQGMEIGAAEMSGMSWREIDRMLERIQSVTSAQVQSVAARYFNDDMLTIATLMPQPLDGAPRPSPASPVSSGTRPH
jgi:zinc protease